MIEDSKEENKVGKMRHRISYLPNGLLNRRKFNKWKNNKLEKCSSNNIN